MVVEVNKLVKSWVSKKFYSLVLQQSAKVLKAEKKIKNLSVALISSHSIKKFNYQYRRINKATDVLSFNDPPQILICWPKVKEQARQQKHSQKKELAILLIHGFLHILGYEHKNKKKRDLMEKQSKKIISLLKKKKLIK